MNEIVETGVKAVDLYAPLPRGGRLAIAGERGSGQLVLAFEIVRNLAERQGTKARFLVADDIEQFRRALREAGVQADVESAADGTAAELRLDGELVATLVVGDDDGAASRVVLSREVLRSGQIPAIDAAQSTTSLDLGEHSQLAATARDEVAKRSLAGASVLAFLRQWFQVAEPWTGQPGEYSSLADTLGGVRQFVSRPA